MSTRVLSRVLWAGVGAAWSAMEARAIRQNDRVEWPAFTDLFVQFRGQPANPPYWALGGLYLWTGYHLFIRGVFRRA